MDIYYMGLEQGSHQKILEGEGETHAGLSFWGLRKRLPKTKEYLLEDRFPASFNILLDSGGYSANKTPTGIEELEAYSDQYEAFVAANIDRVKYVTEFDALALGPDWIQEQRRTFWADVPYEKFVPVWHGGRNSMSELDALAQEYDNVGIPESVLAEHTNLAQRINTLQQKYGTAFHALACAKPHNLHAVRFDTAATTSWLSPMKYGETIVWDRGSNSMHRYTAAQKDQARKRHKNTFIQAGFDADKIIADDPTEVARFTLWSFRQLEANVDKRRPPVSNNPFSVIQGGLSDLPDDDDEKLVDNSGSGTPSPFVETPPANVDNFVPPRAETPFPQGNLPVRRRDPEDRVLLPILGVTPKKEGDGPETSQRFTVSGNNVRLCDNCYVKETCPAMVPGSDCAFNLPVSIKTREELDDVMNMMAELQVSRTLFGVFAEQQEGAVFDPNVSQEIDRTMNTLKKRKEILDNSTYIKHTIEARGQAGVLSRVFGEEAVQSRQEQPALDARIDRMLDSGVIDAEIVE